MALEVAQPILCYLPQLRNHPVVIVYYIRLGNRGNKEVMNTLFLAGLSIGFRIMIWGYGFEMYTSYFCPKEVCYI